MLATAAGRAATDQASSLEPAGSGWDRRPRQAAHGHSWQEDRKRRRTGWREAFSRGLFLGEQSLEVVVDVGDAPADNLPRDADRRGHDAGQDETVQGPHRDRQAMSNFFRRQQVRRRLRVGTTWQHGKPPPRMLAQDQNFLPRWLSDLVYTLSDMPRSCKQKEMQAPRGAPWHRLALRKRGGCAASLPRDS